MTDGFYACDTIRQAMKRIKILERYGMVEIEDESYDGGFNAAEIQDWISKYMAKHGLKLINMLEEKCDDYHKERFDVIFYMRCKDFWTELTADIMKHYKVDFDDYLKVSKGLALIAWFMADDHRSRIEDIFGEIDKKTLMKVELRGYIMHMAMSSVFEILGTNRRNKRSEAKLKKDMIYVERTTHEFIKEVI